MYPDRQEREGEISDYDSFEEGGWFRIHPIGVHAEAVLVSELSNL
jgi:hypothetical protein